MSATRLRAKPAGGIRVLDRPEDVPPDQLAKLRAYRDVLEPILAVFGEVEIVIRPATPLPPAPVWPPKPKLPTDWQNLDGWRLVLGYARTLEHRRWVVGRWAQAAGGSREGGLPDGLPRGLALAELRSALRMVAGAALACCTVTP